MGCRWVSHFFQVKETKLKGAKTVTEERGGERSTDHERDEVLQQLSEEGDGTGRKDHRHRVQDLHLFFLHTAAAPLASFPWLLHSNSSCLLAAQD